MDQAHAVRGADEFRHDKTDERFWNESIYLDLIDASGAIGGYVRLGLYPNEQRAWWTAAVTFEDRGPVVSGIYDFAVEPGPEFSCDRGSDQVRYLVHEPLERVQVLSATSAKAYDTAADAYDPSAGRGVFLEIDLTWETAGTPFHYAVTTRYEIPCTASGTVTIDGEVFTLSGPAQRDHSWGVRDWWTHGWCWAALHFDDGQELHLAHIRVDGVPALGYVQGDGDVRALTSLDVTEVTDGEGLASVAHVTAEPGGFDVTVTPTGYGPLLLVADDGRVSRFPRAMVRCQRADGVAGLGWIEWNQPQ